MYVQNIAKVEVDAVCLKKQVDDLLVPVKHKMQYSNLHLPGKPGYNLPFLLDIFLLSVNGTQIHMFINGATELVFQSFPAGCVFLWATLLMLQNNCGRKGAQDLPSLSSEQDQLGGQKRVAQANLILEKLVFTSSRNLISVFVSDLPTVCCLDQLGFLRLMAVVVCGCCLVLTKFYFQAE